MRPNTKRRPETASVQPSDAELGRTMDFILGIEDEIAPSSGFLVSVMERVQEEVAQTAAPPPIPFPWKIALPGILLTVAVLGWSGFELTRLMLASGAGLSVTQVQMGEIPLPDLEPAGWVLAALLTSLLSWLFARRLVTRSR